MIEWLLASLLIVAFAFLLHALKLPERSNEIVHVAIESLEAFSLPDLTDEQKESKLKKNSIHLFVLLLRILCGIGFAIAIPIGILWLCEKAGVTTLDAVAKLTFSPLFLVVSTAVIILYFIWASRRSKQKKEQDSNYSGLDKLLHELAFKTCGTQVALAKLEDKLFSKRVLNQEIVKPVFVTALPRAGTTLVLECLADIPDFATHTYRDMPFLMTPCFWNYYSRIFQRKIQSKERAHGDGMQISPDSPEAFEEIIWSTFWSKQYMDDRIIPWESESFEAFEEFLRSHIRKILFLRSNKQTKAARYISKNNANIARTGVLRKLFPDAILLIPFRDPIQHAASLLRQHENFLDIHKTDTFAKEYMRAIGHFDFGENLRPIDFDQWFENRVFRDTRTLAFWLEYWVSGYKSLLSQKDNGLRFFNYEFFCQNPEEGLRTLARIVEYDDTSAIIDKASSIKKPRPHPVDTESVPKDLMENVDQIYDQLKKVGEKN